MAGRTCMEVLGIDQEKVEKGVRIPTQVLNYLLEYLNTYLVGTYVALLFFLLQASPENN